jgi:hypothetical protein
MLHYRYVLSLAATGATPWFRTADSDHLTVHINVPAAGTPVGTWAIEITNDLLTVDREHSAGVLPANTAVVRTTLDVSRYGDDWLTGFDGAAERNSWASTWPSPAAFRFVWTRTSGTGTANFFVHAL